MRSAERKSADPNTESPVEAGSRVDRRDDESPKPDVAESQQAEARWIFKGIAVHFDPQEDSIDQDPDSCNTTTRGLP